MNAKLLFAVLSCLWTVWFCPAVLCETGKLPPPVVKPVVNREYLPVVLEMIENAGESIEFIQLEFHYDPTVKKIQDALKAAVKRGVKVRGILEDKVYFNPKSNQFLKGFAVYSLFYLRI